MGRRIEWECRKKQLINSGEATFNRRAILFFVCFKKFLRLTPLSLSLFSSLSLSISLSFSVSVSIFVSLFIYRMYISLFVDINFG